MPAEAADKASLGQQKFASNDAAVNKKGYLISTPKKLESEADADANADVQRANGEEAKEGEASPGANPETMSIE